MSSWSYAFAPFPVLFRFFCFFLW